MGGLRLDQAKFLRALVGPALGAVAPFDHDFSGELDGCRVGSVEEEHRRGGAGVEFLLALLAQKVADGDGNVAEVDVDRAGVETLVAYGTVIGHVAEFVEVLDRDAAPGRRVISTWDSASSFSVLMMAE